MQEMMIVLNNRVLLEIHRNITSGNSYEESVDYEVKYWWPRVISVKKLFRNDLIIFDERRRHLSLIHI